MLRVAEFSKKGVELKEKASLALKSVGKDLRIPENESDAIRLVFVGQYSAGKSSILKMLTGRDDIEIDAGIITQKIHEYDWNGIEVVDTPGIHTELRPDHDEKSYEAIASADMLVFVITNELFDSHMADHFRKIAIDKNKASEMILVVNKMDRTAKGNTPEQQNIIRENLKKVLEPYTPEDFNLSFLDAESYIESVEERNEDPDCANELVTRSGYEQFVDTLNRFVKEKEIPSKLTTELYVIDGQLETAIKELQPKSSDADINGLEEHLRQQKQLLNEIKNHIKQDVKDIYTTAASQVRDKGIDAANLLVEGCKQEEVEEKLNLLIQDADVIIEQCQKDANNAINERLKEAKEQLEGIENSEFSINLKARLEGKFEGLPEGIKKIITNAGSGFQKVGQDVINNAYKAGAQGGLKLTNFSGSTVHQIVLKVGHGVGYKFKPWQAIKISKGIAIGGQVLSVLGVGVSVFMQIKSDQDEEKIRKDLRKNRQNIRSQFNNAAKELEEHSRNDLNIVDEQLNASIANIDDNIQKIRDTCSEGSDKCRQLEALQKECTSLIKEIQSEFKKENRNY